MVEDVAAHIGKYSLRFAKKAERVIAIEPNRETYGILVRNIEADDFHNISALILWVWKDDRIGFFSGPDSGQHSLKRESHRSEIVRADTLDSIVLQSKLVKVDWIKVDVEQAEAEVLEGAQRIMLEMRPKIIVEVWLQNEPRVKTLLSKLGYSAVQISPVLYPFRCSYWLLTPLPA